METPLNHVDVEAYLTGELSQEHERQAEAHLEKCTRCFKEVAALRAVEALIGTVPPEALLDGPPDDGELLLQRTMRQIRTERSRVHPRRSVLAAAAAVVLVAAGLGLGVLVGQSGDDSPVAAAPTSTAPATPTTVPGVRVASATDTHTGARLSVRVEPALGWVRVTAAVTGIPAGQRCRLIVLGHDGTRLLAGSWLVSAAGAKTGTTLEGSALVAPADVAGVLVENTGGKAFVTASL